MPSKMIRVILLAIFVTCAESATSESCTAGVEGGACSNSLLQRTVERKALAAVIEEQPEDVACMTVQGQHQGEYAAGVESGVGCVFPFSFAGATYNECTTDYHPSEAWCGTVASGELGRNFSWGICDTSCPSREVYTSATAVSPALEQCVENKIAEARTTCGEGEPTCEPGCVSAISDMLSRLDGSCCELATDMPRATCAQMIAGHNAQMTSFVRNCQSGQGADGPPIRGTCEEAACEAAGRTLKSAPVAVCAGEECELDECCGPETEIPSAPEVIPGSCSGSQCEEAGLVLKDNLPPTCTAAACTNDECCAEPAKGICNAMVCHDSGKIMMESPPKECAAQVCSAEECCEEMPEAGTCDNQICEDAGLENLAEPVQICAMPVCTPAECCMRRPPPAAPSTPAGATGGAPATAGGPPPAGPVAVE